MGRHFLRELAFVALGLMATAGLTWLFGWGYPMGRRVIWWIGGGVAAISLLLNLRPLADALARDRAERDR